MDNDIRQQIAQLPKLSRPELQLLWFKVYGRAAPPKMRRSLLVPFLAYRIQERAYGGLKASTLAKLRRIARTLEEGGAANSPTHRRALEPGTRIVRHWQGKPHEVSVTDGGFEYAGNTYRSLSEIARKITGTRWSGPAFFGLNRVNKVGDTAHE